MQLLAKIKIKKKEIAQEIAVWSDKRQHRAERC